jgi:hypothetical protein
MQLKPSLEGESRKTMIALLLFTFLIIIKTMQKS